jgi:hypothetical protein
MKEKEERGERRGSVEIKMKIYGRMKGQREKRESKRVELNSRMWKKERRKNKEKL